MFNIAFYFADAVINLTKRFLRVMMISMVVLGVAIAVLVFTCGKDKKVGNESTEKIIEQ
jgi:hypothetical protein